MIRPEDIRHPLLRALLVPGEAVYRGAVALRNALYDAGILKARRLPCPVISLGNLTVGGTGKTPLTSRLAALLHDAGWRTAVLSRGYGRSGRGPCLVSDGRSVLVDADRAGDEPYLIARDNRSVPVAVAADRRQAADLLLSRTAPDVILLDDGYQHRRLDRDLDLLLVDGGDPWGNGRMLPRGPLREPVGAMARADAILVSRSVGKVPAALAAALGRHNPRAPVLHFRIEPEAFVRADGEAVRPASMRGFTAFLFSGIARPEGFEADVRSLGLRVVGSRRFPDHHRYRAADREEIAGAARATGAEIIVTTEKDLVRLDGTPPGGAPVHALRVRVVFSPEDALRTWLLERLSALRAGRLGPRESPS